MYESRYGYLRGNLYENRSEKLSFLGRLRGYSFTDKYKAEVAIYFEKCRSIHTFGMRFDIEILFLDKKNKIIEVSYAKPNKLIFAPKGTHSIVELVVR
ncbi:MAG: DUF192 domain-containing protein [Acidimicrobiia bacterium]